MRTDRSRSHGFTLTEMLVVIGIIVVLVSILIPAVMKSRRQARLTICMTNLKQIGEFFLLYAERNEDCIPLGTSRLKDPSRPGIRPYTPERLPNHPWEWPGYHTRNNQYLWVEGSPSAALGPFLLSGLINPDNAKLLYCPSEMDSTFRYELSRPLYERALKGENVSIVIGYAVRPMQRLWTHNYADRTVEYPRLMPRLMRKDKVTLLAEHPQRLPYTHEVGSSYVINCLYGDSSVRTVPVSAFKEPAGPYFGADSPPYPDGYMPRSNSYAIDEQDPKAVTIWGKLDAQ